MFSLHFPTLYEVSQKLTVKFCKIYFEKGPYKHEVSRCF